MNEPLPSCTSERTYSAPVRARRVPRPGCRGVGCTRMGGWAPAGWEGSRGR